ncbi:hypothetical protein [Haladaptatus sp. CMSO5]|uniref:hypothetical protein n=1 Tax=Haladaptatus sp. CMSO5 TaxID=3120514 RepID=UPI002FCE41E4
MFTHKAPTCFGNPLIIRFYFEESTGAIVSVDPDADLYLLAVAKRCAAELETIETLSPRF